MVRRSTVEIVAELRAVGVHRLDVLSYSSSGDDHVIARANKSRWIGFSFSQHDVGQTTSWRALPRS